MCAFVWRNNCSDADEEDCVCAICGDAEKEKKVMLECDCCLGGFHMCCLTPPLAEVPEVPCAT